ncbi:MAG: hypothetical protein LBK94_02225 [Prevotellaceae bacterium]|jgi:hypothetical protein|nr:hypothetical protein [Prevotellaceae bacterium]
MIKKTVFILFTVALIAVCVLSYINIKKRSYSETYNAFGFAGNDAAIHIRVNNPVQLTADNENSAFFDIVYGNDKFIAPLIANMIPNAADTNFVIRRNYVHVLSSAFVNRNGSLDFVHFIPVKKHADVNKILTDIAKKTNDTLNTNSDISCYEFDGSKFYIHGFDNIIAASSSFSALKSNLQQVKNRQTLAEDALFTDGIRTSGQYVDANIFINSEQLPNLVNTLLDGSISNDDSDFIKNFARWFVLDADITKNLCNFNGFVYTGSHSFLNILSTQHKSELKTLKALSPETLVAYSMQISNIDSLLNRYNVFLSNTANSYFDNLTQISDSLYFDIADFIKSLYPEEITLAYNNMHGWMTLIKVLNAQNAADELSRLNSPNPFPDIITAIFGKMFSFNKGNETSIVDNFIVISKNKVDNLSNTGILSINSDYIVDESLMAFYASPDGISKLFNVPKKKNKDFFKNIFIEIIPSDKKFYINSNLLLTSSPAQNQPRKTAENHTVSEVDTIENVKSPNAVFKQSIENSVNQQKYTILQYADNSIELMDSNAKSLFTVNADEKIESNIFVINPFNKGIAYLLFNTENKIYMIDFNGKPVRGFPVALPAAATNSISVFAYDRTSDFRIFIACTNKKIYLYNTSGENVNGWKIPKTEEIVQSPIRFFRMDSKDYLIAFDSQKIYVFNRKGYERTDVKEKVQIPVNAKFEKLYKPARLRVTDRSGKQVTINLVNGKIIRN